MLYKNTKRMCIACLFVQILMAYLWKKCILYLKVREALGSDCPCVNPVCAPVYLGNHHSFSIPQVPSPKVENSLDTYQKGGADAKWRGAQCSQHYHCTLTHAEPVGKIRPREDHRSSKTNVFSQKTLRLTSESCLSQGKLQAVPTMHT